MSRREEEARRQKEKEERSRRRLQEKAYQEAERGVYSRIQREQSPGPGDRGEWYPEDREGEWPPVVEKKKRGKIVLITLLLMVLAMAAAAVVAHAVLVHRPELPQPEAEEVVESDAEAPTVDGARREDVFTFLLVGRDDKGGGNTDTIMVGCFDVKNGALDVLSIYRDTLVDVPWEIKKINSVYNRQGIEGLQEQIKNLIGYQPDYYFVMELSAVEQLVDAIGGVDYDVPYNMDYDDPTQNLHIHFTKGMQHLDGEDAVRVLRWRKNNSGESLSVGDIGRVEIQHDFLKVMAQQTLRLGNLAKIRQLAEIVDKNLTSNLTYGEMVWFGEKALGMDSENIHFYSLPGDFTGTIWSPTYQNYQSYVFVNPTALLTLVNEHMNPFLQPIRAEDQHVLHGTDVVNEPTLPPDTGLPIIQQGTITGSEAELPTGAIQTQKEPPAAERPTPTEAPRQEEPAVREPTQEEPQGQEEQAQPDIQQPEAEPTPSEAEEPLPSAPEPAAEPDPEPAAPAPVSQDPAPAEPAPEPAE